MDKKKLAIAIVMVAVIGVVIGGVATDWTFGVGSGQDIPGDAGATETTIAFTSYQSGEDVSNFMKISTYHPDYDSGFDPNDDEHIHPSSLTGAYWDLDVNADDAEDVELDLTDEEYSGWFYIVSDPNNDTVFETHYYLMYGGANGEIDLYAYQLSSDVFFSNWNRTDGTVAVPTVNGNYSIQCTDFPLHTDLVWSGRNVGDDWEIDTSDYNDMSYEEKLDYNDEVYFCGQFPLYNPTIDTDHDYDEGLERYTEVFAYKFAMNATIGADGTGTDINVTVNSNDNVEVLISGQYWYLACAETVQPGHKIDYEFTKAVNITTNSITPVRLTVPDDDESGISVAKTYDYSM